MQEYKFIVYDVETKGFSSDVVAIGFYDGYKKYIQNNVLDFLNDIWEYAENKKIKVFGHNAGKFDNKILLEYIYKSKYKKYFSVPNIINGSLYIKLKDKKRSIEFWDSYKILPRSLKKIGLDFGFNKLEYEDYKEHKDKKKLIEYFENDLYITYKIIKEFYTLLEKIISDLGLKFSIRNKKTIAGISFSILLEIEKNGKKIKEITKNFLSKEQEDFIRLSYKGGRTEVFKRKTINAHYYDVNSLYPYVMQNFEYPAGNHTRIRNPTILKYMLETDVLGVLKVKILKSKCENENDIYYLGHKHDNHLVFGNMINVIGYFTSIEIKRALQIGYKIKLIEGIFWENKAKIFDVFVNKFYEIKKEATISNKPALRFIAKLLLNSAYGKYAQRRVNSRIIREKEAINKNIKYSALEFITLDLYKYETESYANRSINPIYATFITAYARDVLYNYMQKVKFDVVYCDTDSIITHNKLNISNEIGGMKEEHFINEGYFIIPKVYSFKNSKQQIILKAKGINLNVENTLCFNDIKDIVENNTIKTINQKRLLGFLEQSKRIFYKAKKSYINEIEFKKVLKSNELKRKVLNKYDTKAIILKGE